MEEERGGSEVDAEMERFPKMTTQPKPQIRSNDDERKQVECDRADRIFKRLTR